MEILDVDASYRDAAARRAACEVRQHVLALQGELRHHAAAEEWDAVLAVNDELVALDPAAADPDGLVGNAREQLTHRREAEEAAAEHRRQVEQLQQQIRERGAAQDLATKLNARVLAIGKPQQPSSHFASVCKARLRLVIPIDGLLTPNLRRRQSRHFPL